MVRPLRMPRPRRTGPSAGHTPDPGFDVVMIGSGLGIYALTRAFHEEYGVVSTVVAANAPAPMHRSITCTVHEPSAGGDEGRLAALLEIAGARPAGRPALLLCNNDAHVEFIARHAEVLGEHYLIRVPDLPTVNLLADKASFAELCQQHRISIPETVVVDFRAGQLPTVGELPFDFPVVAKPAVGGPHAQIRMPGKKKVYFLQDRTELKDLLDRLHTSGFRDRFVLQELIPGDDTAMRSITAYRDARGTVSLLASATVLLEEHTPEALGRPAAMITKDFPEQLEQARILLDATGYVGFANVDIKEDPRDRSQRFLEINPRIGRNNYYVTGAGANVARFMVEDAIHGRTPTPVVGLPSILYSIVPTWLLRRYVLDPAQRAQLREVARRRTVNPWDYPAEGLWMRGYAQAVRLNHVRKFRKHYPKPSATGF
ncbi:D-aspartate ligase [Brachybacterium muris]|uniref:carboxylate--amine ligase n=1 Tax=Brachybacterium muris TaxID=219301 RepID=UPI001EF7F320|nr:carboxylate--amine ligase [Brachybacterium muris]MBM7500150.1 D-aspartate ligase [Brachybacterium muris]MCT1431787.1 carboxylate--amine ligase [Brachybacterium muris]